MPRQLTLNQITLCADGSIGLQWLKQVVENGEVLLSEPHRTVVDFDGDVDAQMEAAFDHLDSMGYKASDDQKARMKGVVRGVDGVGKADADITQARGVKIAAKQRAGAKLPAQTKENGDLKGRTVSPTV